MTLLQSGHFSRFETAVFDPIIAAIKNPHDPWMTAADFRSYIEAQQDVSRAYGDKAGWTKMSVLNTASSGGFSSDRSIGQYRDEIWYPA